MNNFANAAGSSGSFTITVAGNFVVITGPAVAVGTCAEMTWELQDSDGALEMPNDSAGNPCLGRRLTRPARAHWNLWTS
jgi:hypothetical protein